MIAPKIVFTQNVNSIEDTIEWYERVLGWEGHQEIITKSQDINDNAD